MKRSPLFRLLLSVPCVVVAVVIFIGCDGDDCAAAAESSSHNESHNIGEGGGGDAITGDNNIFVASSYLRARNEIQPEYCYGAGDYACYK